MIREACGPGESKEVRRVESKTQDDLVCSDCGGPAEWVLGDGGMCETCYHARSACCAGDDGKDSEEDEGGARCRLRDSSARWEGLQREGL
ncbi:hypothetical protein HNR46_001894 [Haloferula luteola]|uniref:Uncharacterized protein n=1 Tax=Haloferula luteola TaxID=595692 RepID=A0A840V0Y5_9BACT|nr:hypothetical protein [Haloferula luteola]